MSSTQPDAQPRQIPSEGETPTWARDFLRVLGLSLFGVLFFTATVWFAALGLLQEKGGTDPIEADPIWAGICAGVTTFVFPFLFVEFRRNDSGFRRKGLIALVVLSVVIGGVIVTAVMTTWPFILGDRAIPGTVSGELSSDPASIVLLLFFIISGMAWCLSIIMLMTFGGFKYVMWMLLPYLGSVFFFTFGGKRVFENPPSGGSTMFWAVMAVAGLAVLTVVAALRNVIDKSEERPMTGAERDAAYQQYTDDRRRRGLTNEGPPPGIDVRQQGAQQPRWDTRR
ncbi:hypothetical protein [Brevibacterium oceani]|uniref:hypothetical protein n=1 Tax=Brevibacterium oceani TaxID=358099 RepID=UPI0015E748AB|nr:hypothetical protein [Brevibacterium oceani]